MPDCSSRCVVLSVLLVLSGGTNACGGSDSGGARAPSGVNSGVDKTKPASALTQADATRICDAERAYTESHISKDESLGASCVILAAFSGGGQAPPTVAQCQASVKDCKAMVNQMGTTSSNSCTLDPSMLSTCTATVQEIEACMTASVDASAAFFSKITCDIFALPPDQAQKALAVESPQACTVIQSKCPGLDQSSTGSP